MAGGKKLATRRLGRDGPEVSAMGLGCMGMSAGYGTSSTEQENLEVLNHALDMGCTFWDTSDVYGLGENEKLVAKVLQTRRDEVFLCTKFAIAVDPATRQMSIRGDREYVRQCCDASLKRLGISTIDLYYQHRVDTNTPIEETVGAMAELVKEGKVRYLGLSECSGDTLRRAHAVHPIAAVQVEFSPWETCIETNGLLQACRDLGVAVVAYSPLGRGFLTGKVDVAKLDADDFRHNQPRMTGDNLQHNEKLVHKITDMAQARGITAAQLCLAWVLAQGNDVIPIPGTRRLKYLQENVGALDVTLTDAELAQLRDLVTAAQVKGDRYNEQMMAFVNL